MGLDIAWHGLSMTVFIILQVHFLSFPVLNSTENLHLQDLIEVIRKC